MIHNFNKILCFYLIFIFIISIFFVPIIYNADSFYASQDYDDSSFITMSSKYFVWPIPGYTVISSYFGKRNSPTAGASSYHLGIDIPAPEGTYLYAIDDGLVTFASWGAGGGYTIVLQLTNYDNLTVSYCHTSPTMFVEYGEYVSRKEIIGMVGPKNVYGIKNNPYKDENGNPTNGASTGSHLHLAIKSNGQNVNPLDYYDN